MVSSNPASGDRVWVRHGLKARGPSWHASGHGCGVGCNGLKALGSWNGGYMTTCAIGQRLAGAWAGAGTSQPVVADKA